MCFNNESKLSEVSPTAAVARIKKSAGTLTTEIASEFSELNGPAQRKIARETFSNVQRTRKALLLKLRGCRAGCGRKFKVIIALLHDTD